MDERVLVTDAQMRSSLAVIRSLGKKGIKVTGGEETRFATGLFSKYCDKKLVYPSPKKNKEKFIDCLINTIKKDDYDMIIPVANDCLAPIIEYQDELSKYTKIALPKKDIFQNAYDKGNTINAAINVGVPCPKTYFIENIDDLYKMNNVEYPLVIKPRISFGRRGVAICNSFEDLIESYKKVSSEFGNILVQEFIPNGGEFGVYLLFNKNSEPRALTVQRRIRSYPISGGPSTLRETFKSSESVRAVAESIKMLKAMNWVGVAMVEFRIDPRDGRAKLMEVNPRFWGSLQLSILSGVDFPFMLYQLFKKGDVEPQMNYQIGIKCRWLLPGDILWFISAPNKIKNLPSFLDFNTNFDILSWEDPFPTVGFMLATMRYMFDINMWKFVLRK